MPAEAGPAPCPSPQQQQHQFNFQPTQRLRRPRAWERAPTSPFVAHPRGRKVWKRHGSSRNKTSQHGHLPQQIEDGKEKEEEEEEEKAVESEDKMGTRPIKRLRVSTKQATSPADEDGLLHQKDAFERYITTLHDEAPETPKRKRALRKSLRPDGFLRKRERKKSQLLEVTTTVIESCQAVALEKDDQAAYASPTADTDAANTTLGDKDTPTRVRNVLAAYANGNDQNPVAVAETSQTGSAVEDDQSNTAAAAIGQANAALHGQHYPTALGILSPISPAISASTTAYTADELSRVANSIPSESGVVVLIEVPSHSSVEDKPATNSPQCHTISNDTGTREIPDVSSEQTERVGRWTRSRPRFSDDTNLLKDFISRARAKKAAKDDQSDVFARMISPRLSPRAALADVTLSPPQPNELINPPRTSPLKQPLDALNDNDDNDDDNEEGGGEEGEEEEEEEEEDEVDEGDEKLGGAAPIETGSCRRSTRTRFSTPAKTGVMTRIPVRRADGTEPIVLQRSEAQALAIVTRTNTRRNKGQAKPPKLTLKKLPAGAADEVTIAPSQAERGKARAVVWDKKLVYYMDRSEWQEKEEDEEKRPRVRRLRKLGAMNGTPAPKKLFMEMKISSNVDGAPKGRSKSKSKGGRVANLVRGG